ncbi:MAG: hypothetical protein J6O50_10610 [Ruminiclostridium sp.]|nr:hypothetical protein [Ruminiclostridium sp.]
MTLRKYLTLMRAGIIESLQFRLLCCKQKPCAGFRTWLSDTAVKRVSRYAHDRFRQKLSELRFICPYISLMLKADRDILGRSFAQINDQQIGQLAFQNTDISDLLYLNIRDIPSQNMSIILQQLLVNDCYRFLVLDLTIKR